MILILSSSVALRMKTSQMNLEKDSTRSRNESKKTTGDDLLRALAEDFIRDSRTTKRPFKNDFSVPRICLFRFFLSCSKM